MNSQPTSLTQLSMDLDDRGFIHIPSLRAHLPGAGLRENEFNAHWNELVLDENFKSYTTRHRRILRYWYDHPGPLRLNQDSIYIPKVIYDANYAHGANHLAYATSAFIDDQLTQDVLRFDLDVLAPFLTAGQAYTIDVDLFRISASEGKSSPTTSGRHQDGEDWLCMHFIGASNIKRVVSEIYPSDEKEPSLFSKPMTSFLETLIVNDRSLFHAAGPVEQENVAVPAHRNLLLVSISAIVATPDSKR